jgi:hypothetical protein
MKTVVKYGFVGYQVQLDLFYVYKYGFLLFTINSDIVVILGLFRYRSNTWVYSMMRHWLNVFCFFNYVKCKIRVKLFFHLFKLYL